MSNPFHPPEPLPDPEAICEACGFPSLMPAEFLRQVRPGGLDFPIEVKASLMVAAVGLINVCDVAQIKTLEGANGIMISFPNELMARRIAEVFAELAEQLDKVRTVDNEPERN